MDDQVAAARATVVRHSSAIGSWEYAIAAPHPSLRPHVSGSYYGWVEQIAMPLCRREVPTQDVPIIINFGAPFRLFDQAEPSRWTDYRSFTTGAYDSCVLVGSTGPSAGIQVNLSILGARLVLGQPLRELTNRAIELEDLLGRDASRLIQRLHDAPSWDARFAILDRELTAFASVPQCIYVCVPDADAHHDRARAAGAQIIIPLTNQSYGSRDYAVRDPAGHLWSFGTYDMQARDGEPNIFVALYYSDARAALGFLDAAFGFRTSLEVPGPGGGIVHAEMRLGDGAIFIDSGERNPADWSDRVQAVHVCVADPDAHHARAAAAGATITRAPFDTPWARGYYARDLDGFLWGFSTYRGAA